MKLNWDVIWLIDSVLFLMTNYIQKRFHCTNNCQFISDLIELGVQVLYLKSYYDLVIKSMQSELSCGLNEYICTFCDTRFSHLFTIKFISLRNA